MGNTNSEVVYNQNKSKSTLVSLNICKILAMFLIINSHCGGLYSAKFSFLATGGSLGNAVFFIVSGYTLSLGLLHNNKSKFSSWYKKRFIRLYPEAFVLATISIIIVRDYAAEGWNIGTFISRAVFPMTKYWFCVALCIFYIPYFFIVKKCNIQKLYKVYGCIAVIYAFTYLFFVDKGAYNVDKNDTYFRWIYYFLLMLIGYNEKIIDHSKDKFPSACYLAMCIFGFVGLYTFKYLMQQGGIFLQLQFLNQVFVVIFAVNLLKFMIKIENVINKNVLFNKCILFFSRITWEVYLVNFIVISFCAKIIFPLNILCAFLFCIVFGHIVYKIKELIINTCKSKNK